MANIIRTLLLYISLIYFSACIVSGLEISKPLHNGMMIFFFIFGAIVIIRYAVLLFSAIVEKRKTIRRPENTWAPFVSVIVPAYNEENVIEASLISLVELDYHYYEVIVVDDGSDDGTVRIAQQVSQRHPEVPFKIISQSNSGKSWALNVGMLHAQGELVLCVDSDSKLDFQVLKKSIFHFSDPKVGAVGGYVNIINANKFITKLQQLEYVIGLNFIRRSLSLFNIVSVVPGPVGLFRLEAVRQIGGYRTDIDCFAEDADLTVRLLLNGWRVKGETQMIAHTEAPETLYSLLRQRYRWKRGIFQAWYDNVWSLLRTRKIRNILIAGMLMFESFLFDIGNFGVTLFGIVGFLTFATFNMFLWVFAVLALMDLMVFLLVYLGRPHKGRWFFLLLLSKLTYAYILQAWGVLALFDELMATKMDWDKLDRVGFVPQSS